MGANNADLRALARAVLDKSRAAREGVVAAPQVSHAAFARGTAESAQTQRDNPAVSLSHALGLGPWDTSASGPKPADGRLLWNAHGTVERPYGAVLAALRNGCPELMDMADWSQALRDAEAFMRQWAERAKALGWTASDLFGLHKPPESPHPSYRRLSRYDQTGLIWLLKGREVVALTEETAAIRWPGGSITTYRKNNKPALGPLADSLDDLQ